MPDVEHRKKDVKIVCKTKLSGFYDSDNHVLMEVTDPKLYFQYNVFVAILYCCFMYLLKCKMSLATT